MSAEEIAASFLNHYYTTLDSNPQALAGLYQAGSSLTIEGAKLDGPEAIVQKYLSLGQLQHNIPALTKDVQLSTSSSAMLIFVTGHVRIGGYPGCSHLQTAKLSCEPGEEYLTRTGRAISSVLNFTAGRFQPHVKLPPYGNT